MASKYGFLAILFAACLLLCYTSAQDATTPQNSGCQNVTCPFNQVCRMVEVQCIRAPCYHQPSCVASTPQCGPDPCAGMFCPHGRGLDINGCITCACYDPCYGVTCQDGTHCETTDDSATNPVIGECVPTVTRPPCPDFNCSLKCSGFGFKLDNDGCEMCECYDPCENYPCPDNKTCVMSVNDCPEGGECRDGPMRYCADISSTTPSSSGRGDSSDKPVCSIELCIPAPNCTNGRVVDSDGCVRCECRVCGSDPCAGMFCPYGKATDANGCIICGCNEPCYDFICPEGQECHTVVDATTGVFFAQCARQVTMPPCQTVNCGSVTCSQGFEYDSNGCKTCTCRDLCKTRRCPDGQVCVMSGDDCPPGAECRDAPMPYCVDISSLPPTPQSSTYARGGRGDVQESLLQCCTSAGMTDTCLNVCTTNMTLLYSNMETLSGCFQYLGAFLHCASGGQSHTTCCNQRGISESCLYLCSGDAIIDTSNPHAVTQCVISSSQSVLGCFNEGLNDANMTVTQTSTPSSTTAEDICSLAPEGGNCRASMERWYYSATHRACSTFTYGGCGGNGNNFATRDDCLGRCSRSGSVCPDVQCNSSCQITVDMYGCHSCSCGGDCDVVGCPEGQQCQKVPGYCPPSGTNCPLVSACVARPDILCEMPNCTLSCPKGWMTDSTGCPICECKTCPPACDGMFCPYGKAKGSDGCDICDCYEPCQTMDCPDQCRVMVNNISGIYYGECYSVPTLSSTPPVSRSPKPMLCLDGPDYGMSCQANTTRWFYDGSVNSCSPFLFGGCLGNSNNFQSKQICEAMCKDSPCPELDCRSVQDCPYGLKTGDDGCPVCQCLDPCEGMECLGNTVCVSEKSDCADGEACRDPFQRMCIDPSTFISSTTAQPSTTPRDGCPPTCTMYCIQGHEKDANGCDICECRDPCKNCTSDQTCVRMAIDCPVNDPRCANSFIGSCVAKGSTTSSPVASSSPILCRLCMMFCPYLMMKDANGCPVCHCYEPCQGVNCTGNSSCQVMEIGCASDPTGQGCPPNVRYQGQCVETTSVVSSTTATSEVATSSPTPSSPPETPIRCRLCMMFCPYLMMKDANGCPVCHCYEPCQGVNCTGNSSCQVIEIGCAPDPSGQGCPPNVRYQGQCVETTTSTVSTTTTPSSTKRVGCPPRKICPNNCPYGNAKDLNGCYTCDCDDPCMRATCSSTQVCERQAAQGYCELDMCWLAFNAVCTPKCTRQINCNMTNCPYGLAKGTDGCDVCRCYDPCQSVICSADEECAVTPGDTPTGYCTVRCPSMADCKISCEFGYAKNSTGCNVCQCFNPCQDQECEMGQTCVPDKTPMYTGIVPERIYIHQCAVCTETMTCKLACRYDYAKNMTTECDMCKCYEPCQNVKCPSQQVCSPKSQFNGRYQFVPECIDNTTTNDPSSTTTVKTAVCPPVCMMFCQFGMVRDANGCPTCHCNSDPCAAVSCLVNHKCVASQLENGSYSTQCIDTTTSTPVATNPVTNGPSSTPTVKTAVCPPVCMMYCQFGMVRDANGCETCDCNSDPCAGVSCRVNQKCVASPLEDGSYTGQCIDCPLPMCMNPCFYGTLPDPVSGCPSCECRFDPCATVRCPGNCQTLMFCPDSTCTPSPVCVDPTRPCDGLQLAYQKSFGNNVAQMPQLNCDSNGLFKPIQCSEFDCWCVDEYGTPTTNRSTMQINCYSGTQTKETLKIEADFNIIKQEDGWRFKQQVSQQLSNLLGIDESLVTVRKYVSGSIIADVVIGRNANTDMSSVEEKVEAAKQSSFNIAYDGQSYQAILLGGPTSPPSYNTPAANGDTGAKDHVLMIVLICVFVPIGLVAIAITIWLACKIVIGERLGNPRRLSEKSGASTEVDSLESRSDKSYPSDTFSSTITKDEKIAIDTTEA